MGVNIKKRKIHTMKKDAAINRAFAAGLLLTQAVPDELKGLAAEVCRSLDEYVHEPDAKKQYEDIQKVLSENE